MFFFSINLSMCGSIHRITLRGSECWDILAPVLSLFSSLYLYFVCTLVFGRVCQALEDRVTDITPSALSFIDSETPSEKLIFNITKALPPGQGQSELFLACV